MHTYSTNQPWVVTSHKPLMPGVYITGWAGNVRRQFYVVRQQGDYLELGERRAGKVHSRAQSHTVTLEDVWSTALGA